MIYLVSILIYRIEDSQKIAVNKNRCDFACGTDNRSIPLDIPVQTPQPPSTSMPHDNKNTADTPPNRPATRAKNATVHPGTDAKKVLSTRRDPEVIEKEKLERKARKEARERQNVDEAARKEVAQHYTEQLRAQQAIDLEDEESKTPHQRPLAKGK